MKKGKLTIVVSSDFIKLCEKSDKKRKVSIANKDLDVFCDQVTEVINKGKNCTLFTDKNDTENFRKWFGKFKIKDVDVVQNKEFLLILGKKVPSNVEGFEYFFRKPYSNSSFALKDWQKRKPIGMVTCNGEGLDIYTSPFKFKYNDYPSMIKDNFKGVDIYDVIKDIHKRILKKIEGLDIQTIKEETYKIKQETINSQNKCLDKKRVIIITGGQGTGKTTLANELSIKYSFRRPFHHEKQPCPIIEYGDFEGYLHDIKDCVNSSLNIIITVQKQGLQAFMTVANSLGILQDYKIIDLDKQTPQIGDVVKAWDDDKSNFVYGVLEDIYSVERPYVVSDRIYENIEKVTEISINDFKTK